MVLTTVSSTPQGRAAARPQFPAVVEAYPSIQAATTGSAAVTSHLLTRQLPWNAFGRRLRVSRCSCSLWLLYYQRTTHYALPASRQMARRIRVTTITNARGNSRRYHSKVLQWSTLSLRRWQADLSERLLCGHYDVIALQELGVPVEAL